MEESRKSKLDLGLASIEWVVDETDVSFGEFVMFISYLKLD